jgi:hypothetical protein
VQEEGGSELTRGQGDGFADTCAQIAMGNFQLLIRFDFCLNSISAILKKEFEWAGGSP